MKKLITCLLAFPILLASCQENGIDSSPEQEISASKLNALKLVKVNIDKSVLYKKSSNKKGDFENRVAILNEALLEHNIQLVKMEFLGAEGAGKTVFFSNVGNKQLTSDFVPNDPRNWFPNHPENIAIPPYLGEWTDGSLAYYIDGIDQGTSSGMTVDQTISAIHSTMNTWGSVSCSEGLVISNQGVTSLADYGDVGLVQFFEGFGGFPGFAPGTITHAGNLPAAFFDAIGGPGGGNNILGVTFTWTWGTDIDQNGKNDVALKEIYINDGFNWQDAPDDVLFNDIFDYETVVLHEVGHGLSQGHFGKAFGTDANRKIHFAPYALMNAGYTIAQREITATDNAGHCSMWGDWPNN